MRTPRDEGDEPEPYQGPFVVLRPVGMGFVVTVDPPLPDGHDRTRTFSTKDAAWNYAQATWSDNRLPLLDLSAGNVSRQFSG